MSKVLQLYDITKIYNAYVLVNIATFLKVMVLVVCSGIHIVTSVILFQPSKKIRGRLKSLRQPLI